MKFNKKIVVLYVLGIVAGVALVFTPVILGGVESKILGYVYVWAGFGLFMFSLAFLEMYISKRKRPDLLRRLKIEAKDERIIIAKDKAGTRTLYYLWSMIMISWVVFSWFDVELDYALLMRSYLGISVILYFAHLYYYKKRL